MKTEANPRWTRSLALLMFALVCWGQCLTHASGGNPFKRTWLTAGTCDYGYAEYACTDGADQIYSSQCYSWW
jgi:hypothetical protein